MKNETKEKKTPAKINKKKLEQLIKTLREGDSFSKEKAQEALLAAPDPSVIEAVAPLLKASDTGTRMFALEILKAAGNHNIECITSLLDDENEDVRVYACEIITCLKNPDTLPALMKKVTGDADNVRNAACMALGEFDDDRAVDALLEALKDDDWVTFTAIFSLGKIGNKKTIPPLLEVFRNGNEEISLAACETLIDFKDTDILDQVIETLKGWDEKKRDAYMRVMLEKGEEDVFLRMKEKIGEELFDHLLSCVDYGNRRSLPVIKLLANFKTEPACNAILEALAHLDPEAEEYDEVLGYFMDLSDVWAGLADEYFAKGEQYYFPVLKACTMGGIRVGDDVLLEAFRNAPVDVRREIAASVERIAVGTGYDLIREALGDADGHVQGNAAQAAGMMGLTDLVDDIGRLSRTSYPDVRAKALKALIRLDQAKATAIIEEFIGNGSQDDKRVFLAAASGLGNERNYPYLTKLLGDQDETIRKGAIVVIGRFVDDERYMQILRGLLKEEEVPHEALKVVKERGLTGFRDRLVELFLDQEKGMWTRYYALSALDGFKDSSLFNLYLKGLEDESSLIRIGSINALSDLNDPKALVHIAPFTMSDDEDIRSAAEAAIGRLENL